MQADNEIESLIDKIALRELAGDAARVSEKRWMHGLGLRFPTRFKAVSTCQVVSREVDTLDLLALRDRVPSRSASGNSPSQTP